ncbi:MAG: helix-turn-helix transcriptional regulator [Hyphomicrobiaceae bacterium]|nr:helix-turn-helix transcriptional regulator [Hyphomicrobiaceae bacterium]
MLPVTHHGLWAALDQIAERHGLSPSALARRAGLDPTSFNRSKRTANDGRPRWPSTESLVKVLEATGESFSSFVQLLEQAPELKEAYPDQMTRTVPLLGMAEAGQGGYFDDAGFPAGAGWDAVPIPGVQDEHAYALEVSGDSMLPLYRDGDLLIVSPGAQVRRGDRVVVRTRGGEVTAKVLARKSAKSIELVSLNPDHPNRSIELADVEWIARIVWASQ